MSKQGIDRWLEVLDMAVKYIAEYRKNPDEERKRLRKELPIIVAVTALFAFVFLFAVIEISEFYGY